MMLLWPGERNSPGGVTFDPIVADTADRATPTATPGGIPHVLISDEFVVHDSALPGELLSRVLRRYGGL
jgi:hypothetical protein